MISWRMGERQPRTDVGMTCLATLKYGFTYIYCCGFHVLVWSVIYYVYIQAATVRGGGGGGTRVPRRNMKNILSPQTSEKKFWWLDEKYGE